MRVETTSFPDHFLFNSEGQFRMKVSAGWVLSRGRRCEELFPAGCGLEPSKDPRSARKTEVTLYLANHELAAFVADLRTHDAIIVGREEEDLFPVIIPLLFHCGFQLTGANRNASLQALPLG